MTPASAGPDAYPHDLVADAETAFGTVHLRPIRPDDAEALSAFHERLSRQSQYLRFFNAHPHLSPIEVQRFTTVDYRDRLALVAEVGGDLVAVARYDRVIDTTDAEVAFVVADAYQNHGLGALLLHRLAAAAADRGITRFTAETLAENHKMQGVFRDSGFDVRSQYDGGVIRVTFPIRPVTASGGLQAPGSGR